MNSTFLYFVFNAIVSSQAPRAKIIVDAVKAFAKLPIDVRELDFDLMGFKRLKI